MKEMKFKQRLLSQNFLTDPRLVAHLVSLAKFKQSDTVIDIGAGTGALTAELAKVAGEVIAVEIDSELTDQLKTKFAGQQNVTIHNEDILRFPMPSSPYKVFANVPFHITADLIHKLTYYAASPIECYLIVQKEAAMKFGGIPKETLVSTSRKPYFIFSVAYTFKKSDFSPMPAVECVLLKCTKRPVPLVPKEEELLYTKFLKYAFTHGKDLKSGLAQIFTYKQWKRLARANNFPTHVGATDLTFDQWLGLFHYLLQGVNPAKYKVLL